MDGDAGAAGGATPPAGAGTGPQVGASAGGQAPPAGDGQAPPASAGGESAEARAARLERELGEARKEAAGYRTKATALEKQQQDAAQAQMTDLQKAEARAQAAEQAANEATAQVRAARIQNAAITAATKLGYRNPELAFRLLDPNAIEYTDAGEPKNIEHLLKHLAERETYLVRASGAGADFGGGPRGEPQGDKPPGMGELLRAALVNR